MPSTIDARPCAPARQTRAAKSATERETSRPQTGEPGARRAWQVRTANVGDLPFIQDGELGYIREREPAQEAAWLRAVERNRDLWSANLDRTTVAEFAGEPAAYVMWAVLDGVATVVTLYVPPAHRGQGLGTALLDVVVRDVERSGHDVLALGVHR